MQQNIFLKVGSPEWDGVLSIVRAETRLTTIKELRGDQEVWLSVHEAMAHLEIKSLNTLYKYRDEHNSPIKASGTGKAARYLKSSLNDYRKWKQW